MKIKIICFQGGVCSAGQAGPSHRGLFWTGRSAGSEVIARENVQVCPLVLLSLYIIFHTSFFYYVFIFYFKLHKVNTHLFILLGLFQIKSQR